jgi:hypothetical protein
MPLPWAQLLARVSARASHHRDKNEHSERDVRAWMALSTGSTQFKPGTDFWSTRAVGVVPPINWVRCLPEGRCRRITRCLSEAEPIPEGASSRGRWRDVAWMVTAFSWQAR